MEFKTTTKTQKSDRANRSSSSAVKSTPQTPTHKLLQMQQTIGNRAVSRLIQTKLKVGKPGDVYEREADRIADRVMQMPNPQGKLGLTNTLAIQSLSIQRMGSEEDSVSRMAMEEEKPIPEQAEDEESSVQMREEDETKVLQPQMMEEKDESLQMKEEDEPVQTKASNSPAIATPKLENRLSSSQQGGTPLAPDVQNFMEPRFGRSFVDVRVHTDGEAVQMNKELGAQAFTHGNNIYFGAGKSPNNDALTAHELTHVVQQAGRQSLPTLQCDEINNSAASEKLAAIQGLPMYELLPALSKLPGEILNDEGMGQYVGGSRLVLAMQAARAKREETVASFLEKNESILLKFETTNPDQVNNIRVFLGLPEKNYSSDNISSSYTDNGLKGGASGVSNLEPPLPRGVAPFPNMNYERHVLEKLRFFTKENNSYLENNISKADLTKLYREAVSSGIKDGNVKLSNGQTWYVRTFDGKFHPVEGPGILNITRQELNLLKTFVTQAKSGDQGQALKNLARAMQNLKYNISPHMERALNIVGEKLGISEQTMAKALAAFGNPVKEAPESLVEAAKIKGAGKAFRLVKWGGRILLVVAIAADIYEVYEAHWQPKVIAEKVGAWAASLAAAGYAAEASSPLLAAGPWGWVAYAGITVVAGAGGYIIGGKATKTVYEWGLE